MQSHALTLIFVLSVNISHFSVTVGTEICVLF